MKVMLLRREVQTGTYDLLLGGEVVHDDGRRSGDVHQRAVVVSREADRRYRIRIFPAAISVLLLRLELVPAAADVCVLVPVSVPAAVPAPIQ